VAARPLPVSIKNLGHLYILLFYYLGKKKRKGVKYWGYGSTVVSLPSN
jgi:hypothetical protein